MQIFSRIYYTLYALSERYTRILCDLDCSFFKFPELREEEEEQEEMFSKIKKPPYA